MLLYFKTKNYRSLKNEAILDMEAAGMKDNAADLLSFGKNDYLPAAAVYGKNGGGKSNLIHRLRKQKFPSVRSGWIIILPMNRQSLNFAMFITALNIYMVFLLRRRK